MKLLTFISISFSNDEETDREDGKIAEIQKKKLLKKIADSKLTQVKTKVIAQKKSNFEIDKEIEEMKQVIQDKLEQNEKLSIRVKELKGMIIERKKSINQSQPLVPATPKLPEEDLSEL